MRILILGDVSGRSGRRAVTSQLPGLRDRYDLDFVVVNGENAAGGHGITEKIFLELCDAGADVVTTGNHVWDQRETVTVIDRCDRLLRPANFPSGTPGKGSGLFEARNGAQILVINVMGRVFMNPLDCPFQTMERELAACPLGEGADAVIVDFHAEASSEKQAMAHFLDGRVSLLAGTHTHVPTADHRVLPGGTAYVTDIGMCGDYDSVLGVEKDEPLQRFLTGVPRKRFQPAGGEATLSGLLVEVNPKTGLALWVAPLRLGGELAPAAPDIPPTPSANA